MRSDDWEKVFNFYGHRRYFSPLGVSKKEGKTLNKCDCGAKLQLDKMISILDEYDDKFMVCNRYYCPECGDEYEINEELNQTDVYIYKHMRAFENWKEGNVAKVWHNEDNILCIKYESGNWWHYRLNSFNEIEWW